MHGFGWVEDTLSDREGPWGFVIVVTASSSFLYSERGGTNERDAVQTHLDHGQTRILDTAGHFKLAIILFNLRDRWCASRWREGRRSSTRYSSSAHVISIQTRANSVNRICLRPRSLMSPPVRLVHVKFSTLERKFQRGNLCFPSFLHFARVEPGYRPLENLKIRPILLLLVSRTLCRTKLSDPRSPNLALEFKSVFIDHGRRGLYPRDFDVIGKENL